MSEEHGYVGDVVDIFRGGGEARVHGRDDVDGRNRLAGIEFAVGFRKRKSLVVGRAGGKGSAVLTDEIQCAVNPESEGEVERLPVGGSIGGLAGKGGSLLRSNSLIEREERESLVHASLRNRSARGLGHNGRGRQGGRTHTE